jgi:hypothetical protein
MIKIYLSTAANRIHLSALGRKLLAIEDLKKSKLEIAIVDEAQV